MEIEIVCPKGYVIDEEKSSFSHIIFKEKKWLPKTWEELKVVSGYAVNTTSNICKVHYLDASNGNENTFKYVDEAKASIAMAKLSQLKDFYNDGWKPDWKDTSFKYVLFVNKGEVCKERTHGLSVFLSFKSKELRDEFFDNFKDLIMEAAPLL